MLLGVSVVSPKGQFWPSLDINTYAAPEDLLSLRAVKGLEPAPASVVTKAYGAADGEFYNGTRVQKRNIVLTIGLSTDWPNAADRGRSILYDYFTQRDKALLQLQFRFDNKPPVTIGCYVETFDNNRFDKDAEVTISLIAPKPNFVGVYRQFNGYSNNIYDAPYGGNALGTLDVEVYTNDVRYNGDVIIESEAYPGSGFRQMRFEDIYIPRYGKLVVSTHQGHKRAIVYPPSGKPVNVLAKLKPRHWLVLYNAPNRFRVRTPASAHNRTWMLRYSELFKGV